MTASFFARRSIGFVVALCVVAALAQWLIGSAYGQASATGGTSDDAQIEIEINIPFEEPQDAFERAYLQEYGVAAYSRFKNAKRMEQQFQAIVHGFNVALGPDPQARLQSAARIAALLPAIVEESFGVGHPYIPLHEQSDYMLAARPQDGATHPVASDGQSVEVQYRFYQLDETGERREIAETPSYDVVDSLEWRLNAGKLTIDRARNLVTEPGSTGGGDSSPPRIDRSISASENSTLRQGLVSMNQGGAQAVAPVARMGNISGGYVPTTVSSATAVLSTYKSIPGGVVLEGEGEDIGEVSTLEYDGGTNAFLINDTWVYFSPLGHEQTAQILEAIHADEIMGVSLGGVDIVYGALDTNSSAALDLKIVDLFLAEFVFASDYWTNGYSFAEDYDPKRNVGERINQTVFFKFSGFGFDKSDGVVRPSASSFEVTLVPLSGGAAEDGGHSPDYELIEAGKASPQYEANASHLGTHISYYAREPIVEKAFRMGQLAAFSRALRRNGINLEGLAREVRSSQRRLAARNTRLQQMYDEVADQLANLSGGGDPMASLALSVPPTSMIPEEEPHQERTEVPFPEAGQEGVAFLGRWIQIFSRSDLSEAIQLATDYRKRVSEDAAVFRHDTGLYVVALGPYAEANAALWHEHLVQSGEIPSDSFTRDSARLTELLWGGEGLLALNIQHHLARLGCEPGPLDGDWGPMSQAALNEFGRRTGQPEEQLRLDTALISDLASRSDRVCPPSGNSG